MKGQLARNKELHDADVQRGYYYIYTVCGVAVVAVLWTFVLPAALRDFSHTARQLEWLLGAEAGSRSDLLPGPAPGAAAEGTEL